MAMASPTRTPPTLSPIKKLEKHSSEKHVGLISADRININRALDSTPTAVMRTELEEAGVELPDDAALTELSVKYNGWIETYRHDQRLPASATWYNLFAELDKDGDGMITFDELVQVTRSKLGKGETSMPVNTIKALWCALDADDSNRVHLEELGHFLKGDVQR